MISAIWHTIRISISASSLIIALLFTFFYTDSALACNWTGSQNSSWGNSQNWTSCGGGIPQNNSNVQLRPWFLNGASAFPTITSAVTVNSISIQGSSVSSPAILNIGNNGVLTVNTVDISGTGGLLNMLDGSAMTVNSEFNTGWNGSFATDGAQVTINSDASFHIYDFSNSTISISGDLSTATAGGGSVSNSVLNIGENLSFGHHVTFTNGGEINVEGRMTVTNSRNVNLGTATLNIYGSPTLGDNGLNGNLNVQDGTVNFLGNTTIGQSGNVTVGTGTINIGSASPPISADFTLNGNSTFNLGQGSLNIYGESNFTASGQFDAGSGVITFMGDITFSGNSDFEAGTSTTIIAGEVTIATLNNNNQNTVTFYNLEVVEGGNTTSTSNILVLNSMTVDPDAFYENVNNTTLNVIGEVTGVPPNDQEVPRPYIIDLIILNETTIKAVFNMTLDPATSQNTANYTVRNGITAGSTLLSNISSAVLNGTEVTLTLQSITVSQNVDYYLHTVNVKGPDANGQTVNTPHVKRFTNTGPPPCDNTFYSNSTGNWNVSSSWTCNSHGGDPQSRWPNQVGDEVVIGSNHTITITNTVTLSDLGSIIVNNTGTLTVGSMGTLQLGSVTLGGSGTFVLASGGTIEIGSADGITDSGGGNIQTTVRSFSSSGNYVYNGTAFQNTGNGLPGAVQNLTIDNSFGVRLDENVHVNGLLTLESGEFIIPSGISINAPNQDYNSGVFRALRTIHVPTSGPAGWRMISSPIANLNYSQFYNGFYTQGFPGATSNVAGAGNPNQPNVLWYDETIEGTDNQRWVMPSNASNSVVPGRGLFTYVFGNVAPWNQSTAKLSVAGQENQGTINLPITYTPEGDEGWNLVGNPFLSIINWDAGSGWTKTSLDNTIYVWDVNDPSGYGGGFKEWNGTTGSLGNGHIMPFQGFWVKANAPGAILSVGQDAKNSGLSGTFYTKDVVTENSPEIVISLKTGSMISSTYLLFTPDAKSELDPLDAHKMRHLGDTFIELATLDSKGNRLAINNLPSRFSRQIEIPLHVEGFENFNGINVDAELLISQLKNVPHHWKIEIVDRDQKNKLFEADQNASYSFRLVTNTTLYKSQNKQSMNMIESLGTPVLSKTETTQARFIIRITPGEVDPEIPTEFGISQNYPNPFNPSTTIPVMLASDGDIDIQVFDLLGRSVATIFNGYQRAGYYSFNFNARGLSSGVYLVRLVSVDGLITRKISLIK